MKYFLALLFICATFVKSEIAPQSEDWKFLEDVDELDIHSKKLPTETDIKNMIHKIRDEYKPLYNNYEFEDLALPIHDANHGIDINVKASGAIKGLLDFEVTKFSGILGYTFEFDWSDKIEVIIKPYDLKGNINLIEIFGHGNISLSIPKLHLGGAIVLTPTGFPIKEVKVTRFDLKDITIGDPKFELTGWLDDEVLSEAISKLITHSIPQILDAYGPIIKKTINDIVMKLVKDIKIPLPT